MLLCPFPCLLFVTYYSPIIIMLELRYNISYEEVFFRAIMLFIIGSSRIVTMVRFYVQRNNPLCSNYPLFRLCPIVTYYAKRIGGIFEFTQALIYFRWLKNISAGFILVSMQQKYFWHAVCMCRTNFGIFCGSKLDDKIYTITSQYLWKFHSLFKY